MENTTGPQLTRTQLRIVAESEEASPTARLDAANSLIDLYGATARNLRIAKRIAKRFAVFVGDSEIGQRRIRWEAEKLKAKLERIRDRDMVDDGAEEEDAAEMSVEPVVRPASKSVIDGVHFLPPDEIDDEFWDREVSGRTPRALFLASWGLSATATRAEFMATCRAHPELIRTHTLRMQLWALTREQADEKFARDEELVRAAFAERALEDSDVGREQLVRDITESGQPLFEFQSHEVGPILTRSPEGLLLDAIDFVRRWRGQRANHQPL